MIPTSTIRVESSIHGQLRRTQRDITKRDLKAAVKYGTKERGFPCPRTHRPRWKYTYADVVYITDETSTLEVTSWALELPLLRKVIPGNYVVRNEEAKKRLESDPGMITSHTVLIVDMSGSMRSSDMNGHKSRARGVYYNLAEQFIATALPPMDETGVYTAGNARSYTDVVTLIEMRSTPTVIFDKEPFSWLLYNQFVELSEAQGARSHGNYYSSFVRAFEILDEHVHQGKCATSIFFFSDGKPSDYTTTYLGSITFPSNLYDLITEKALRFGDRLSFFAMGYGAATEDFSIMKEMVECAKRSGANTFFGSSYHDDMLLSSTLSSLTSSLTQTRTMLSRLDLGNEGGKRAEREKVSTQKHSIQEKDKFSFDNENWRFFNGKGGLVAEARQELRLLTDPKTGWKSYKWTPVPLQHPSATGIAVSNAYFGEGAERIVFLMDEIDRENRIVGQPLVAKESLYKHKQQELKYLRRWHTTFLKTQFAAAKLAVSFNSHLDSLHVSKAVPRIQFLPCSVYECRDEREEDKAYAFLAEPRLKPEDYMKWNDNTGRVDGIMKDNPAARGMIKDLEREGRFQELMAHNNPRRHGTKVEAIEEGDEEEEEEEDHCPTDVAPASRFITTFEMNRVRALEAQVLESDIPQAFSHYTHCITKRSQLVCDLQGVLSIHEGNPVFFLTDPCIHSLHLNKRGKPRFGLTDKGYKGMQAFFRTHHCNAVCEILGITGGKK